MRIVPALAVAGLLLTAAPAWSQTAESDVAAFRRLRAEGVAAASADDLAGAARLLAEADTRVPNHPGLILMRARIAAAAGRPEEAMTQLSRYAAAGLVLNLAGDRALSALTGHPDFDALAAVIEANRAPVGAGRMTAIARIDGPVIAWTWYALIGSLITFSVAFLASLVIPTKNDEVSV